MSDDLEDLLTEAAAMGLKAMNLFATPEGKFQCNVAGSDRWDYKIKTGDTPVEAIKLALKRKKRDSDII